MLKVCWACLVLNVDASDRKGNNFQLIFLAFSISSKASFPIPLFSPGKNAKMHAAGDSVKHLFHSNIAQELLHSAVEVANSIVALLQIVPCSATMIHCRIAHCFWNIQFRILAARNIQENPFPASNQRSREKFQTQLNIKETVCARRLICQGQEIGQELIHFAQRSLKDVKFPLLWLHLVV